MSYFSQYIKTIITTGLFAFLCEFISSHFSNGGTLAKAVKLITNLCIFTVAISPVFSLFSGASFHYITPDFKNNQQATYDTFISFTENELEKSITEQIYRQTGIQLQTISIDLLYEEQTSVIKSITATVRDETEKNEVLEYIKNLFSGSTETTITVNTNDEN